MEPTIYVHCMRCMTLYLTLHTTMLTQHSTKDMKSILNSLFFYSNEPIKIPNIFILAALDTASANVGRRFRSYWSLILQVLVNTTYKGIASFIGCIRSIIRAVF